MKLPATVLPPAPVLMLTPSFAFAEMTLPVPAVVPPIVLPLAPSAMEMPVPLGIARRPAALRPM